MTSVRIRILSALGLAAFVVAACSFAPFGMLGSGGEQADPPITLKRCDDVQDVLCLLTFGVEPPDRMLVTLLTVPGLPSGLEVVVTYHGEEQLYECESTATAPTVLYCVGPQIPLGTKLLIQVRATEANTLLAAGEFTLMALALPTVPEGGIGFPTPGARLGARISRRLSPGANSMTPTARITPLATPTPAAATGYPNPTPGRTLRPGATQSPTPSPTP